MKKIMLAAAMALALGGTAQAKLVDYAQVFGGATIEPNLDFGGFSYKMTPGYNVGASLGWWVSSDISIEAEGMYTSTQYDCCSTSLETFSVMANGVYHFDVGSAWKPYIGVGIGTIQSNYNGVLNAWVFGYQGFAGFAIPINPTLDFFAEYKYQGSSDASDLGTTWGYSSHNLDIGLRFDL